MEKTFRKYQENVFDVLVDFFIKNSHTPSARGFVVMPPRSGKTLIFTELIRRLKVRSIVAVPTLTILEQNYREMVSQNLSVKLSVYAEGRRDLSGDVIFTTYQSLLRLIKNGIVTRDFVRLVICDEAHRALSLERSKIADHLNAVYLGFTATDKFSEEKQAEKVFKNELYRMPLVEAIEDGILLPLRGMIVETEIDLRQVQISRRDALDEKVAQKVLNIAARNKVARDFYLKRLKNVPAVFFCLDIKHATQMAKYLRNSGVRAEEIHSKIKVKKREEILDAFSQGKLDVLCSRDILIEGWDSGRVVAELNLRPTYSWVLAEQRACRVVTPYPGKKTGLIVEFQDIYRKGDQPIFVHHLFRERKYRQGGYVMAPEKMRAEEEVEILAKNEIFIVGDLKVSSKVRTVAEIGRINNDADFSDAELIKNILFSREDVDYRSISFSDFKSLNFPHPQFDGNGETLLRRYLGVLWTNRAEDFEMFLQDVLGEYFLDMLADSFETVDKRKVRAVPAECDLIEDVFNAQRKDFIDKVLKTLSPREEKVIRARFGIGEKEQKLWEIAGPQNCTPNNIRIIEAKALRKLKHPSRYIILKRFESIN